MNCSALKQSAGSIQWLSYYAKNAIWWDFPLKEVCKYQVKLWKETFFCKQTIFLISLQWKKHVENLYDQKK